MGECGAAAGAGLRGYRDTSRNQVLLTFAWQVGASTPHGRHNTQNLDICTILFYYRTQELKLQFNYSCPTGEKRKERIFAMADP